MASASATDTCENEDVLLRDYLSLRFKIRNILPEELENSDDYKRLLRTEHKLRNLSLSLDQIVEMGLTFLTEEEVRETSVYKGRVKELEDTRGRYDRLRDRYRELARKVEDVFRPHFGLKTLIEKQRENQERDDYL